jgi:Fe-S cluster biogenesis protein NfuA
MDHDIKMTAHIEPHRPDTCKFVVDAALYESRSAFFADQEQAKASPLAEKLFGIENVTAVRISGNTVAVTKQGEEPWRAVAGKVAGIIREHLTSGEPAVSKDAVSDTLSDEGLRAKVREILDTQINPAVADHGGVVDLLDVKEGKIYIHMGGGCQGCGMADVTLRQGIEAAIRQALPQVDEILDVTDHAAGTNPYYAPSKK